MQQIYPENTYLEVLKYWNYIENIESIETTFRDGFSPVNLLLIFRTPFPKNTSGPMLLELLSV